MHRFKTQAVSIVNLSFLCWMFLKNVMWDICRKMHVGIAKTSETIVGKIRDSNVKLKSSWKKVF